MHPNGVEEASCPAAGAQRVGHERATPGAEFHEMDGGGTAERQPPLDAPQAEQLAEHLADLRRGAEIARRTERVAPAVIAVAGMSERSEGRRDGKRGVST